MVLEVRTMLLSAWEDINGEGPWGGLLGFRKCSVSFFFFAFYPSIFRYSSWHIRKCSVSWTFVFYLVVRIRLMHLVLCILFSSVQSLSHVRLFGTPWTTARQASLSITNSWSSPKPMSIELVMPSNHLILCRPFLLLPSIFPSIRVFSNESALYIRWPKYWSFSFNISPSSEHPGLISFRMDWLDLLVSYNFS